MKLLRLFLALLVCFVALPLFVGGGYLPHLANRLRALHLNRRLHARRPFLVPLTHRNTSGAEAA